MKKSEISETFTRVYLSVVQILVKLADTMFLFCELGRGSGKTTHILAPRLDRVQASMLGSIVVLAADTYRSIFDNILPGILEYFNEHYERGIYFEIGKEPPIHFKKCYTYIADWKHTISFCNGCVVQFVSCDRPESMLGKNAAHLLVDEMLRIPEDKFIERIIPALRADRSKFGDSPYFMGISGFSSTPNFETDEDWFLEYEKNMNKELVDCIQEIAYEIDLRLQELEIEKKSLNWQRAKQLEKFVERWTKRLSMFRKGQTFYLRASSLSNLKILGIDYIQNQMKSIKDKDKLYTSIFAIRKLKVKDMFFGKFGKPHLYDNGYDYEYIDQISAGDKIEDSAKHLRYYDKKQPLYAGYDPGPFSSIVFAQRKKQAKEFRVLKNMWVIHPDQQEELAKKIDDFFKNHDKNQKVIYLHYDRAANQRDPEWKKYYPNAKPAGINDTDAILLKKELTALGWTVHLMSKNQKTIYYSQHYRLLNLLFGKNDGKRDTILIDKNECEQLVSSINHSPLKRHEGRIWLDKSSESLPFDEQIYNSTQIATALLYLLWGEFHKLLPDSDQDTVVPQGAGTYSARG
ncbi:MAG: hypothetical protein FWF54_03265 [Candidatus Azobacteroides sp.]|nr:hypothetical protein [Candidatus Azobacteroides sp.]